MTQKDTKERMIEMAHKMVAEEGIDSVSMRALGDELGLSRSAIYRHFANKEALLATMVTRHLRWFKQLLTVLPASDSLKKDFSEMLKMYYELGTANPNHYRLMFNVTWDQAVYPEVHEAEKELFDYMYQKVALLGMDDKKVMSITSNAYAFVHGLVGLNIAGHLGETEGFTDPLALINEFVERCVA